jgi:hypothetical protein
MNLNTKITVEVNRIVLTVSKGRYRNGCTWPTPLTSWFNDSQKTIRFLHLEEG